MGLLSKYNMADSQKKLVTVPETWVKKRKQNAEHRAKRAKAAFLMKKQNREKRKVYFKRAEKYVKEYRVMEREQIRLARQAKNTETSMSHPSPSLLWSSELEVSTVSTPGPVRYFSCSVFARLTTLPSCVSTRQPFTCSVLPSLTSQWVTPT